MSDISHLLICCFTQLLPVKAIFSSTYKTSKPYASLKEYAQISFFHFFINYENKGKRGQLFAKLAEDLSSWIQAWSNWQCVTAKKVLTIQLALLTFYVKFQGNPNSLHRISRILCR
jgi:hypothetical protein